MKPPFKKVIAAIILVLSLLAPSFAGPLEDADTAYRKDDYATALRLLRPLADQGHPIAQSLLGIMYLNGAGVAQDYAEAMKWYGLSANQGYAPAQTGLGLMYFNGTGATRDYTEAMRWFRLAADQGYFLAQFMLGNMYYNGSGIPQDYAEAMQWYSLAANQNYAPAQDNLGVMYRMCILYCSGVSVTMLGVRVKTWNGVVTVTTETRAPRAFVAELVGIEGGVVSGVFNLESSDVGASDRRPRHEEQSRLERPHSACRVNFYCPTLHGVVLNFFPRGACHCREGPPHFRSPDARHVSFDHAPRQGEGRLGELAANGNRHHRAHARLASQPSVMSAKTSTGLLERSCASRALRARS
jgi:uncharacterized protein